MLFLLTTYTLLTAKHIELLNFYKIHLVLFLKVEEFALGTVGVFHDFDKLCNGCSNKGLDHGWDGWPIHLLLTQCKRNTQQLHLMSIHIIGKKFLFYWNTLHLRYFMPEFLTLDSRLESVHSALCLLWNTEWYFWWDLRHQGLVSQAQTPRPRVTGSDTKAPCHRLRHQGPVSQAQTPRPRVTGAR